MDVARIDVDGMAPTVPRLIRRRASLGDKKFLVADSEVLTYAEAERRSAELARGLLALGIGKGSHVGLLYPNGADFLVATLAAARIGAVTLPLSTLSTVHELRSLLSSADVRLLLATGGYRSRDFVQIVREAIPELDPDSPFPLYSATAPALRHAFFSGGGGPVPENWRLQLLADAAGAVSDELLAAVEDRVVPADRLVIVHTSGSTSAPKAVIHNHGELIRHMASFNEMRRYDDSEILFSNSPFFWIGGYASNYIATLVAGATLVCSNSRDAGESLDVIERERPTLLNGYAVSVAPLAEHPSFPGRDLSFIRRGNLYPIMPAAARPADPELHHQMLGMTEGGSVVLFSADESEQPENRRGSFGTACPGFEAQIRDPDTGRLSDEGESGELWLRGPFMMEGYYGRERGDTFDPDGWYATGDRATRDRDGFIYFKGRWSEMIKTAGANVSPREVEEAIREVTGLVAHVVGVTDPSRGQNVAAVIVTADPASVDETEIRRELAGRLSPYKIPRVIRAMTAAEVPVMSSGKLDLIALRKALG
jgi:acyl-CoA synthetase (AMP-forming)/AMP-acid ligase II